MGTSDHGTTYIRVGGDDADLRLPPPCVRRAVRCAQSEAVQANSYPLSPAPPRRARAMTRSSHSRWLSAIASPPIRRHTFTKVNPVCF